jgi:hypothetical protein
MTTHASSTFKIAGWDEKTWDGRAYNEVEGAKLTHAVVKRTYEGDIQGESTSHVLMYYRDDGWVILNGFEQISGSIHGKRGSFVLEHSGTVENGIVKGRWSVVPSSATGDLKGLRGIGESDIDHADSYPFSLDYDFEG